MKKQWKVAVIGCGNISVMHLDSVVALDVSELVAVCDTKPERANATAEKYNTKAYIDYQEMFQKEELDVAHICLPHYLHTVVARDAFRAGIHVISEKPMSIDYEDAVETVELAKQCNLQYGVIFQCRYNNSSKIVKENLENYAKQNFLHLVQILIGLNMPHSRPLSPETPTLCGVMLLSVVKCLKMRR